MTVYIVSAGDHYYPTKNDIKLVTSDSQKAYEKKRELEEMETTYGKTYDWVEMKTYQVED